MLTDFGSGASIIGVVISLFGLGFALLQLSRLRGETHAARIASEEALNLYKRELANTDLARLRERIQRLMEIHRQRDAIRALDQYREIWEMFLAVRQRLPYLSVGLRAEIQRAVEDITEMQRLVEGIESDKISPEQYLDFNSTLLRIQSDLLANIAESIEESRPAR